MKRSEINDTIRLAIDFLDAFRFRLPKWAFWKMPNWEHSGDEVLVIKTSHLGWDITDFGLGAFRDHGLALFTLRNGDLGYQTGPTHNTASAAARRPRPVRYSEKIMLLQNRQACPMLFLESRDRDLVNRGGGDLIVRLYGSTPDDGLDRSHRAAVHVNSIAYNIKPGGTIRLTPGDGLTLPARMYHDMWAEKSSCLVGEISMTCDEGMDYHFHKAATQRFPEIEEDEEPLHLLFYEYPRV
jgi:D-lyxose ketol-isomerase